MATFTPIFKLVRSVMRRIPAVPALALVVSVLAIGTAPRPGAAAATAPRPGVDWPQFRGIAASGIAEGFSVPQKWNAADGTNVVWNTPIPGLGLSSPIVWGDDIFVSTSISGKADSNLKVGYY